MQNQDDLYQENLAQEAAQEFDNAQDKLSYQAYQDEMAEEHYEKYVKGNDTTVVNVCDIF